MNAWRLGPAAWLLGLVGSALAQAASAVDPLQTPTCLAARAQLDATMAEPRPDMVRLRAARQRAAHACLRSAADSAATPPRRMQPESVQPVATPLAPTPRPAAAPAIAAPPAPQPLQVQRCDAAGCWGDGGQRLNRVGNHLVDPQGRMCTQQGTVLVCP